MSGPIRDITRLFVLSAIVLALLWVFRDRIGEGIALMEGFAGTPYAVPIAFLVFFLGSVVLIPQWALIASAVAAFGLIEGMVVAWIATLFSTSIHMGFARGFERVIRTHSDNDRFERLRGLFSRSSFQSGLIVRLVPTGPAIIVNMVAVIVGVRYAAFLAGTAIGIVPKIVLTAMIASGLVSAAQGQVVALWLVGAGLVLLVALILFGRHQSRN